MRFCISVDTCGNLRSCRVTLLFSYWKKFAKFHQFAHCRHDIFNKHQPISLKFGRDAGRGSIYSVNHDFRDWSNTQEDMRPDVCGFSGKITLKFMPLVTHNYKQ